MKQVLFVNQGKNEVVESKDYNKEEELQDLIKNNPSLLKSIFDSPLLIIGRENSRIDVLALTKDAVPVIIECKRKDNPDMRYLIAQVFEYASLLNQRNYNEFSEMVSSYFSSERCQEEFYKNSNLAEAFDKFKKENSIDEMDDFDFQEQISENLEKGKFYLLIIVDKIYETPMRTINFLNEKLKDIRLEVIEISKFSNDSTEIFVPQHINRNDESKKGKSSPGKTTIEEIISNADQNQAETIRKFRDTWVNDFEFQIEMGKGFSARYKNASVLWVYQDNMQVATPFGKQVNDINLHDELKELFINYFGSTKVGSTKVEFINSNFSNEKMLNFLNEVKKDILPRIKLN